ncbi:hypothetical protein QLH64_30935 (plasmid) [Pseudomonas brassicacearum]|nr:MULTISPECIES: hypothetical protein [Pseudomonas]KQW19851.1 hypothetical protein ASC85_08360 [Pseudomonas sp. Root401]WHS57436.1 hypothetical protein QLH64_30935 [Pseudomonas brassicacearum]
MSRMNEVLSIAEDIARLRQSDKIPATNLLARCRETLIYGDEFKAALAEAIEAGRLQETEDGQLLLLNHG